MVGEALSDLLSDAEPLIKLADEEQTSFVAKMTAAEVRLKFAAS